MINPFHVLQAARNATRMSRDEQTRRLLSAFVSRDIYQAGRRLKNLAQRVGDGYAEEVETFLQENRILEIDQVWDLEEANELREKVNKRIQEAQERLKGN
jgi:predicted sugar kinase